jgi:hypothetical protein
LHIMTRDTRFLGPYASNAILTLVLLPKKEAINPLHSRMKASLLIVHIT